MYKVKPEYDQKYKDPKVLDDNIYIGNELYTEKEVVRENLNREYMELVDVKPKTIFYSFGARFSTEYTD